MAAEKVSFGYRDVSPEEKRRLVSCQFDAVAKTYDLADTVLSAGLDARWRRKAISAVGLETGETVLDLCGGTGRLALLAAARTGPDGRVVIYDFNWAMMEAGKPRLGRATAGRAIRFVQGEAEHLALPGEAVDAITLGFGLRNFVDPAAGLAEMARVLRPGGRLMILEFSVPRNRTLRSLYNVYSFRIMPLLARLVSGTDGPYRYLAESIRVFPPPEAILERLEEAGFAEAACRRLTGGIAVIYTARKP